MVAVGELAIEAHGLRRVFGDRVAVDDVSFTVRRGEVFGFLGPNGAGKTTTISMLTTLLAPTAGTARLAGRDVRREPGAVRRHIGLVFQQTTLDTMLTAEENLLFHAVLHGVGRRTAGEQARRLLRVVELDDRRTHRVQTFSGGMRRRLEVVRALLHRPTVLFLDEPTVGLDPRSRATVWDQIDDALRLDGTTLFLTTHYLDEADRCDRIAIIDEGRIVAVDTPANLKAAVDHDRILISTSDDDRAAAEIRAELSLPATTGPQGVEIRMPDGEGAVARIVRALSVGVRTVSVRKASLDDAFLQLTGHTIRKAE